MYTTSQNRIDDPATQCAFMRRHSFAALVTSASGAIQASHLPFLIEESAAAVQLHAHMAKPNPQWRDLLDAEGAAAEVMVLFGSPHAYVSPRHYERAQAVPTWNYAAIHAYGTPRLIEAHEAKLDLMRRLIALHDTDYAARFPSLPKSYIAAMLDGVVAFSIAVTRVDARFKLSQEKSSVERARIAAELDASDDSAARETAALMRRHAPPG